MTLAAGQTLTHYEILGLLGVGGMGEVYRAKDTRLDREVAIKVLPEELAADDERLRRFEREAKTLASLNHPNVAGIHGVDQVDDVCFLALELVPGEDLAARLSHGALRLDEAIDVCRQIAEGLEAAHEAGVVHRDLKPANVRITPDGVVKILDFGLAKPIHPKATREGTTTAESDSFLMTEAGLVLGTPTYMSPEQARGKPVDRRTDIWAFGCVLFECLTGRRAFGGDSLTDVLASIVGAEPDWSRLPSMPARVEELLRRTLNKDPRARLRDVGEARIALEEAAREPLGRAQTPARAGSGVPILLGALGIVIALAVGFTLGRSKGAKREPTGAEQTEPGVYAQVQAFPKGALGSFFSISPDGRSFSWKDEKGIWVRRMDELQPVLVHDQEVQQLCWSPDSEELAFLHDEAAWRISADGGYPERVPGGEADPGCTLSWLADGRLLFGNQEVVWTVPADGGEREVLLELDVKAEGGHWHLVHPLPDGGVLGALHDFSQEFQTIEVYRGGDASEVVFQIPEGEFSGLVLSDGGNLVYGVKIEGAFSLWSVPFSLDELRPLGDPRRIVEHADQPSVSRDGALAYLQGDEGAGQGQLAWLGIGEPELTLLDEPHDRLRAVRLSPDGDRIVFSAGPYPRPTFFVFDLGRGVSAPVLQHEVAIEAIWLDEGHLVVTSFLDPGGSFLYALSGRGEPEHLSADMLVAVSPDGQYFVYATVEPNWEGSRSKLVGSDGEVLPYLSPEDDFLDFSPDGRWMLYGSERSGTRQVYLSRFPPSGDEDWSVCVADAENAWFREDLSAIYYVIRSGPDDAIHRVELSLEPEVVLGAPETVRDLDRDTQVQDYDGADRFLVISISPSSGMTRAYAHTNWEKTRAHR